MKDPFLYKRNIPIRFIQNKVSEITEIPMVEMLSRTNPGSRKREYVEARQISMKLSKMFTTKSLAVIGRSHNGFDHATVLHAIRTVDNLIDTKDVNMTDKFWKAYTEVNKYTADKIYEPFSDQTDEVVNINKLLEE